MSEYIVSARKYRPQTFDTVVGQEHITTTLKNAIRNQHLAHAYLFCGPRGVGKTTCARILAKTINCENPTPDMEACGACHLCMSFNNNASFNVFELDAASNNSVDDIRDLISQVRFAPQQGKYKVYIIDEVHMLSQQAFNAFLKTLEEPPPFAIFILATTEKHKILPTILSRCQIFDFKRITTNDIVLHLQSIAGKEGMNAQEAALHVIARKSEGCMRDALSMLDRIAGFTNGFLSYANTMEHLNLLDADFYFGLNDLLLSGDVGGTLLFLDNALEKGFEGDTIIGGLAEHLRNLLLCKDKRMVRLLDVPNEHRPIFYEKANQTPPSFILSALNVINACELEYKNANNRRLHVEMCLIRLCYLLKTVNAEQLADSDEKKNADHEQITTPVSSQPPKMAQNGTQLPVNQHENMAKAEVKTTAQQSAQVPIPTVQINTPAPAKNTGDIAPPASKKLHLGMLDDLDQAMNAAAASRKEVKKELTIELASGIFEKYKQILQTEGKNMLHAQFSMIRLEILPPDEVHMISGSPLADNYVKEQRNFLIDFFYKESGFPIRITTSISNDENAHNDLLPKVLSKQEMFEAMVRENPNILKLKDALGLQVEY